MRYGGRVLLVFLNLCIRIIIRVATFDTNHSVADCTQTINRYFNTETSFCSPVIQRSSPQTVDVSGETIRLSISLRLEIDILDVTYIKDKQMLLFNIIFDLLLVSRGSSASSVAFSGFLELKWIQKQGPEPLCPGGHWVPSSFLSNGYGVGAVSPRVKYSGYEAGHEHLMPT